MALDFPTSPTNGQKYPQPPVAGQPVYTWDGEKWKAAGSGVLPTIMVSDSPPINPPDNALWWESDSGLLYLRYNDGDTSQWVIAAPQPDISLFFNSPTFTGDPKAPTPATADNDTSIATTAFVKAQGYAPLADPALTGNPTAPTPAFGDNDTSIATTAFVRAEYAPLASPTLTGTPAAPTAAVADDSTKIATTAWVRTQYLQNSVVFDPPSQATNVVGVIQTLTVTGAAVGDYCLVSFSVDLNGMILVAWVSAANTVKFQFQNKTAGTLDLASGTVRVRVWKQ
jgi:hypothetical protein